MSKVVIFGTSNFSTCLRKILEVEGVHEVVAYTLSRSYIKNSSFSGLPVVPLEDLGCFFNMSECEIALTIGYTKMNDNRKHIYELCKQYNYKIFTYISNNALVYSDEIGEGTLIYPGVFIGPYVNIGKCVVLHMHVSVTHHNIIGDYSFFADGTVIGGDTSIGTNCFVGMNCTIRNDIKIGDRVLIGAGCKVNCNLNDNFVVNTDSSKIVNGLNSDFFARYI